MTAVALWHKQSWHVCDRLSPKGKPEKRWMHLASGLPYIPGWFHFIFFPFLILWGKTLLLANFIGIGRHLWRSFTEKKEKGMGPRHVFIILLEQDSSLCRTAFLSAHISVVSWRRYMFSSSTSRPQGEEPRTRKNNRTPGQATQNCCSSRARVQWSVETQRWKREEEGTVFGIEPWRKDGVSTQRWWMMRDKRSPSAVVSCDSCLPKIQYMTFKNEDWHFPGGRLVKKILTFQLPPLVLRSSVLPRKLPSFGARSSHQLATSTAPGSPHLALTRTMVQVLEPACIYSALILHNNEVMVMEDKINTLIKAAGVNAELFCQACLQELGPMATSEASSALWGWWTYPIHYCHPSWGENVEAKKESEESDDLLLASLFD